MTLNQRVCFAVRPTVRDFTANKLNNVYAFKKIGENPRNRQQKLYVGTLKLLMAMYTVCLVGNIGTVPSEVRSNAYQQPISAS
jgi:hypothetical protein